MSTEGEVFDAVVPPATIAMLDWGLWPCSMDQEPDNILRPQVVISHTQLVHVGRTPAQIRAPAPGNVGLPVDLTRARVVAVQVLD